MKAASFSHPWLLAGDFNKTRSLNKRDHGGPDMVRGLSPSTKKSARLDRALCNMEWRARFPEGGVKHLVRNQSNHAPILILMAGFSQLMKDVKLFKFQATWLLHSGFEELIRRSWMSTTHLNFVLDELANKLSHWNKEVFGNLFRRKRSTNMERKPHLVAWATVMRPSGEEGLGIRAMRDLNSASMANLGWRLIHEPESLWAGILRHKYCKGRMEVQAFESGPMPSNGWKDISESKLILHKGLTHSIGDGK
ncbi:hypothetical protein Cgig2_032612 [Carnegiea gigantea]|uniref:Reverse transcriptase n=1 Tax=Carnegiea gigantea TaxID=171969 RepID=A0A9Q1QQN9_9CARY|nr:hypothetical protein Cgig2_032612 [Carnegiea gigantea]